MSEERRDKHNYYLDIAESVLERGTCLRRKYGASCADILEYLEKAKQELDEDDADVFAYKIPQGQDFVDVSECIRQLVLLQEPVAPVKNPDEDFIFVSNNPPDEGSDGAAKPMDPRWEKLKALKSKMENRS